MHSQFAQDSVVSQNKELADNFKQYGKQNANRMDFLSFFSSFFLILNYNQMVEHDSQYDLTSCHRHHTVISK